MGSARELFISTVIFLLRQLGKLNCFFVGLNYPPNRNSIPPIDDSNLISPAIELSKQIKTGRISSEQVVQSFISRIKKVNPIIKAVVDTRFERALEEARAIDRKISEARDGKGDKSILEKPLVGVPISVKETVGLEGQSFTGGLVSRRSVKAARNNDVVNEIIEAGIIPICTTNIPEMAMYWDTSNKVYEATNNPYDLSRIPGGSSGGEGSLIGSGSSILGVGNDIAGSIRIPANFCCIYGHKPTPFAVSDEGMFPVFSGARKKLNVTGPLTRYACDLLPLLKVMVGGKKASELRLDDPVDLTKLKIYYVEDLKYSPADPCDFDIIERIRYAAAHMSNKFKIPIERVELDQLKHGFSMWISEFNQDSNSESVFDIMKIHPLVEILQLFSGLSEHTINTVTFGLYEQFWIYYGKGKTNALRREAEVFRNKFNKLLGQNGLLFMPTHCEPAPKHSTSWLKLFNASYTAVNSVLQCPITQCPLGMCKEGLPVGMQILATPNNDRLSIAVASELESVFGGWWPPCRLSVLRNPEECGLV